MNQRLIPVRCWSCNKPLQEIWASFRKASVGGEAPSEILTRLMVKRYCCRRMLLTQPLSLELPQKRDEELDSAFPPAMPPISPLIGGSTGEKSEEFDERSPPVIIPLGGELDGLSPPAVNPLGGGSAGDRSEESGIMSMAGEAAARDGENHL